MASLERHPWSLPLASFVIALAASVLIGPMHRALALRAVQQTTGCVRMTGVDLKVLTRHPALKDVGGSSVNLALVKADPERIDTSFASGTVRPCPLSGQKRGCNADLRAYKVSDANASTHLTFDPKAPNVEACVTTIVLTECSDKMPNACEDFEIIQFWKNVGAEGWQLDKTPAPGEQKPENPFLRPRGKSNDEWVHLDGPGLIRGAVSEVKGTKHSEYKAWVICTKPKLEICGVWTFTVLVETKGKACSVTTAGPDYKAHDANDPDFNKIYKPGLHQFPQYIPPP